MQAKALAAALAILAPVCSTSWADGSLAPDLDFYTLGPCRAVDTRAGAPLTSGAPRTFQIAGPCGIPGTAKALAHGNGDGIIGGTRNVPTPIDVSVRTLDGTSCVATLSNAFTLAPPNTACTGDHSTPPLPPR